MAAFHRLIFLWRQNASLACLQLSGTRLTNATSRVHFKFWNIRCSIITAEAEATNHHGNEANEHHMHA